jgi:Type IV Pilus-assembly protein W
MRKKDFRLTKKTAGSARRGFTMIELLIGGSVMLVIVLGSLSIYMKSNKVAVEQNMYAEMQHDVRSGMYFISRDTRMAGVGLTADLADYFVEGKDAYGTAPESPDMIKLFGNFDDPLNLVIEDYHGGAGGGADEAKLYDWSLENSPYPCPDYYENRTVMIMSTRCPGCWEFRYIGFNSVHGCNSNGSDEHVNFQPGMSELNPPGGLVDPGNCPADCWIDAIITIGQVKQYWLDKTGNPADYPDLTNLDSAHGYTGIPSTLYDSTMNEQGAVRHLPVAQNIENLQFQYNADMDNDGLLDGFRDWNDGWSLDQRSQIQQVRIWVLGRTAAPFTSVSGSPPTGVHLYRRPAIANSAAGDQDDRRKRFLLDSTASIRNLSMNLYNAGTR